MIALVALKPVPDPEAVPRVGGDGITPELLDPRWVANPFDDVALEAAVQWREAGALSAVVAVCVGDDTGVGVLRTALAQGADRAVWVHAPALPSPDWVVGALAAVARREAARLVLLGRQGVDGDRGCTAPALATLLGWPLGSFVTALLPVGEGLGAGIQVTREVEGGSERRQLALPAVLSADLRWVTPRHPSLPAILRARGKPLESLKDLDLGERSPVRGGQRVALSPPPARPRGERVATVAAFLRHMRQRGVLTG
ncbi:MAG: electron transfer flavoprotein subunit beta/FixA family protein [Magnetococcus sp. WYHC-3]